jgi:hypothetical protein
LQEIKEIQKSWVKPTSTTLSLGLVTKGNENYPILFPPPSPSGLVNSDVIGEEKEENQGEKIFQKNERKGNIELDPSTPEEHIEMDLGQKMEMKL